MSKIIWKTQEFIEDVPFRVYRWKHYIIILQYPSDKIKLSQFRIAISKNYQKPKLVSMHSTYSDALIYIKMYQHEFEMEFNNAKSFSQTVIKKIKTILEFVKKHML